MKDKQVACILLIGVVLLMVFLTQKQYKSLKSLQADADSKRQEAVMAQGAYNNAKINLDRLKQSTDHIREFYEDWEGHLDNTKSPQATEQMVIDSVKAAEVFALSQRFELLQQKDDPLFKSVLRAHLTIEDEYSKAFNWLSSLESGIPTCRVTSLRVVRGDSGDDIHMELIVDFPILST